VRKLILMSVLFVTVAAPWRFAADGRARRGMRWTVVFMALFILAWSLCGPRLFFMAPAPTD
jgi:hypothetical protein